VLAARVERVATHGAVLPPVLAHTTWGTKRQAKTILESYLEVLLRNGLGLLILEGSGQLQKASNPGSAHRAQVNPVVLT